jgi:hypothetical protein
MTPTTCRAATMRPASDADIIEYPLSTLYRTTVLTIPTAMTLMRVETLTSKTCIIPPKVRASARSRVLLSADNPLAKKEDTPEEALKAFKAIVDQEDEKGDWFVPASLEVHLSFPAHPIP